MHFYVMIFCPRSMIILLISFLSLSGGLSPISAQIHVIDTTMHFLRSGEIREWSAFPSNVERHALNVQFTAQPNMTEYTFSLRQFDVKSDWNVFINQQKIGTLTIDEKDMTSYFVVPVQLLRDGLNELVISTIGTDSDDIKVGNLKIDARPLPIILSEAMIEVSIVDADSGHPLPARITIVNSEYVLQPVTTSSPELATRPGCVYTGTGVAVFTMPAGSYKLYAGRGFEYSIDSLKIELKPGDKIKKSLSITREVDTRGWISSDTHIHTFTYSKHGDATIRERAITLAAEGIELPILTDHNIHVDLAPVAKNMKVDQYFTSVTGNEVTTKIGHFNFFRTSPDEKVIDPNVSSWDALAANFAEKQSEPVIILNHAQDAHHNFRPFGSERHLSSAGVGKSDWIFPANAMEVINSGSQQTHPMKLFYDWFGMLNHGINLTPVGSSDSHDVNRFIVGQGRTYILGDDNDPGLIDVDNALKNLVDGKVMVSLGLMTKILVNKRYGPGDLTPKTTTLTVDIEVSGPSWVNADRIILYANGKKIREEKVDPQNESSTKWRGTWDVKIADQDIYLVAIAEGPGTGLPFWPIAKPYQPRSPDWTPRLIGATGAVWIDGDGNGKRDAAVNYAKAILNLADGDIKKIVTLLRAYDEAVAMQVAALLWKEGTDLKDKSVVEALFQASPQTNAGFDKILQEIRLLK